MSPAETPGMIYPFPEPPGFGELREVAPGLLWTRIPLPFRLDHVNIYLIEDGDGWAVLDTGIGNDPTREIWQKLVEGPLAGRPLTRLIVTHFHPDHIGLAGWLCERYGLPLLTSLSCYLGCLNISLKPGSLEAQPYREFYLRHGMATETADLVATQGHDYLRMVTPLPPTFSRVVAGDVLRIGGRDFDVLMGDGHAPDQIMLSCAADKIFLAADQVLAKITPNISIWEVDPDGDPLGLYLRSLRSLAERIDPEALVLPGHQLPFYGLQARCRELAAHHEERCRRIAEACRQGAKSIADLVPVLFTRPLDPHQMSFAFSETHAHVNSMVRTGELVWQRAMDGRMRVVLAG
ncbi:MBL fold metallo-hydrolase [Rhodoligotrophos appendicifer]|uniref:MBL fold metallo-hydrolase n=1 Tax=Rhodoligotrophos appendicifer TaxID=987056 RepID=UPI0019616B07|nr:MBL fold metallo-hydrolase [Rhodoligotrophos appendicifer]